MKMDFYLILPSNVKFINNKIGNFQTQLAKKIKLEGNWVCGLKCISFTKSWYNVPKEVTVNVANTHRQHKRYPKHKKLPAGNYSTQQLLKKLNDKQKTFPGPPTLLFNGSQNKFGFVPGSILPGERQYPLIWCTPKLGIESMIFRDIPQIKTEKGEDDLEIIYTDNADLLDLVEDVVLLKPLYADDVFNNDISTLVVSSNIVEHTPFGDKAKQLLRVVEIPKKKFGDQVVIRYDEPQYVPLQSKEFQTIQIDIKDENENNIQFEFGRVIITIHFKNE